MPVWKWFLKRYEYDILKIDRYHGVLLITSDEKTLDAIMIRVIGINPTFCNKYFIFTVPGLIHLGKCVYNNETRNISDVLSLLKQEMDNKEKQPGWRSAF